MQIEGGDPQAQAIKPVINGVPTKHAYNNQQNNNPSDNEENINATLSTATVELLRALSEYDGTDPTRRANYPILGPIKTQML